MGNLKKGFLFLMMFVFVFAMLSACSQPGESGTTSEGQSGNPSAVQKDPVTVKASLSGAYVNVFETYMLPAMKEKLPHITLENVEHIGGGKKLEETIASGDIPDIMMPNGNLFPYLDVEILTDLNGLIKKHNFDTSVIAPSLIQSIKNYSSNGKLFALPADRNVTILLYNKDIFDRFALSYPTDNMSWDEIFDMAKKLTRKHEGVQYRGLSTSHGIFSSQLSAHIFDENGKADLSSPEWRKVVEAWEKYNDIPDIKASPGGRKGFTKDQTVAMLMTHPSFLIREPVPGINWDMAASPTFENGLTRDGLGSMLTITATSEQKDAAFEVMKLWYSDEIQTAVSSGAALISAVPSASVQKNYGIDNESAKDLNLKSNFPPKQAIKVVEKDADVANPIINEAFKEIAAGGKDVNTIFREAEEKIDMAVNEKYGK